MAQVDPLAQEREWLAMRENDYLHAKEYVKSDQYEADIIAIVSKMRKLVPPGREWNGDKALFAIGGVDHVLSEFAAKTAIIAEYESKQKSIRLHTGR